MKRAYWLNLFTFETWNEFLNSGANVSGFREKRWKTVQTIKPGDIFLCYLTGLSRWIGLLEATGPAFLDDKPIWKNSSFPARIPVELLVKLDPEIAPPVIEMNNELSMFKNLKSPHAWTGRFRGSPSKWSQDDGEAVVQAIHLAQSNPIYRPLDPIKLARIPPILKTQHLGDVTIPNDDPPTSANLVLINDNNVETAAKDTTTHTEIQWLLLTLGMEMGLDVWVAKNDRNRSYNGIALSSIGKPKVSLPIQFDDATTRTIELIDVLWLKGNAIQAAFEIESTTSIYSGLLRMADLISMQPNLNIPLYIVAPKERHSKVLSEVNRPTFQQLTPKLSTICRYISFEDLREKYILASSFKRFLKPEFLDSFSHDCDLLQQS